jgi:hypothetical protein
MDARPNSYVGVCMAPLPCRIGVTAARLTLDRLVKVRILLRQLSIFPAKLTEVQDAITVVSPFYTSYYTNALAGVPFILHS